MNAQTTQLLIAVGSLAWGASPARAHLAFINFEDAPFGGSVVPGEVISNQFNMWGTIYQGDLLTIRNNPLTAISPNQVAVLTHAADPTIAPLLRFDFVYHGTSTQSTGDFVGIIAVNAASPNTIFTMSAWDTEDGLIASLSTVVENTNRYDMLEDEELVIFHPNIAYITLTATANGLPVEVEIDNLRYNHLIPSPGVLGVVVGGLVMVGRRRR